MGLLRSGNKRAAAMIECLCYLAVAAIILAVLFPLVTRVHSAARELLAIHSLQSSMYAAADFLARDIRQSPALVERWKCCQQEAIVWQTPKGDIGWALQDDVLVRIIGTYNKESHQWQTKNRATVLENVSSVRFTHTRDPERGTFAFVSFDIESTAFAKKVTVDGCAMPQCQRIIHESA